MSLAPRIDRIDRNHIINGAFDYWQRVAGNTSTISGTGGITQFTADRFLSSLGGTGTKGISVSRNADVPTLAQAGIILPYSYNVAVSTAATSFFGSDSIEPLIYRMEGYDYSNIATKSMVLSFWIKTAVTGTYGVYFKSYAAVRTYVTSFTVTTAATWQYVQVPVTLDPTTANYNLTNGMGLAIGIGAIGGTTFYNNTANTWLNADTGGTSGLTNWMASTSNYIRIAGLSFTENYGFAQGQFIRAGRSVAEELRLCQRYYEKSIEIEVVPGAIVGGAGPGVHVWINKTTSYAVGTAAYKATKRVQPSVVLYRPSTGTAGQTENTENAGATTAAVSINGSAGFGVIFSATSGFNNNYTQFYWSADAEL